MHVCALSVEFNGLLEIARAGSHSRGEREGERDGCCKARIERTSGLVVGTWNGVQKLR